MTPTPRRVLSVLAAAVVGLLVTAPAADAISGVDAVAASLRQSPVYADPAAEKPLSADEQGALLSQVSQAGTPLYVAVLPASFVAENGGTANAALTNLHRAVGLPGTYAMVAGSQLRVNSTLFPVNALGAQAVASHQGGTSFEVLSEFVSGVTALASSGGTGSESGSGGFPWGLLLLGGAVVLVGVLLYRGYAASKATAAAALAEVRGVVDEDVTEFGEQLAAFDLSDPRLDDAGRADLQKALDSYDQAKSAAEGMTRAAGAGAVTAALGSGRYAMECVRARLEGHPIPALRPPCFFDPRHGPSVADLAWAPPGGAPRQVPVCAACQTTVATGATPAGREVPVGPGGASAPYWNAGPAFGGYAGGYYTAFGAVLPGILMGTMLGGMMSSPGAYDSGPGVADAGVDTGWAGGFGGGDFGGGGGGDFGGGDFGGGDSGGGGF